MVLMLSLSKHGGRRTIAAECRSKAKNAALHPNSRTIREPCFLGESEMTVR